MNWCVAGDLDSIQVRQQWFGRVGMGLAAVEIGCLGALRRDTLIRPPPRFVRSLLLWILALMSARLLHTASIHWRTWRFSLVLAALDRERRGEAAKAQLGG